MEETKSAQDQGNPALQFGGGGAVATMGVFSGMAIAIGVPWVLLAFGQSLGSGPLVTLIVIALASGGLVALTSAFFGLVMPRHIHGGAWMDPERWAKMAEHRRHWRELRWRHRHGYAPGEDEEDGEDGDPEGAPARKGRRRR